jgi:Ca-activated chloride channel family protein
VRRALILAAALLLAAPAAAAAQASAPREPVVGGGSFADAPLLGSGRYRDTILPGERLYYGVRLEPGQRLRVRAKLGVAPGEIDTDTAAGFSIGLQTPLREVITDTDEDITGNSTVGSVEDEYNVIFPPAVATSATRDGIGAYRGPGIWYPSLYLTSVERRPAKVELPVDFELEVIGDPQADASPEPTPAEPTPTPTPEGEQDGGGTSAAAVAAIGLVGLLAGLVGGGLAGRRGRA